MPNGNKETDATYKTSNTEVNQRKKIVLYLMRISYFVKSFKMCKPFNLTDIDIFLVIIIVEHFRWRNKITRYLL